MILHSSLSPISTPDRGVVADSIETIVESVRLDWTDPIDPFRAAMSGSSNVGCVAHDMLELRDDDWESVAPSSNG